MRSPESFEEREDKLPYGVSVASSHSLLIIEGSVYAWGCNGSGQLGDGTTNDSAIPKLLENLNDVVAVSWGYYHSMAMTKDGDVYLWGNNDCGQLGNGTTDDSKIPKKCTLTNINMIACSNGSFSMALNNDGEVYMWGNNSVGQLGNGSITRVTTPQKVTDLTNIAAIACGAQHSIVLSKNGDVYSWGGNNYGQLGNGTTTSSIVPLKIDNLTDITAIACSFRHVLALTCEGDVYSWGHNAYGELGNGTTNNTLIPEKIAHLTNIVAIACGYFHSMALTNDGDVYSWGYNGYGQLGIESTTNSTTPQLINTLKNVSAIACLGHHSMVLTRHGQVYVWGSNSDGRLGNGTSTKSTTPQILPFPPGTLQWLNPHNSLFLYPPLSPRLQRHMESLSNTLHLEHDYHECHSLYTNQTQFHLHKAILAVRAPELLKFKELDIETTLFQGIIHFMYTNTPLNFEEMKISQIIQIIHVCKQINLVDLVPSCQQALIASLTNDNVFEAANKCCLLNLNEELDWITWFIGKNKLQPSPEAILKLTSNPTFISKLIGQVANLTLSPPEFSLQPKTLLDVMEVLFLQKMFTDFTIHFKSTPIKVHKFVLIPRWPYFTNIMLKNQSTIVHESPMPLDTFSKLIQYFYVGAKNFTMKDCGWILSLSDFYLLHDEKLLLKYCNHTVNSQLSNWTSALQLAMEIDNPDLEDKVISMIPDSTNPRQIVSFCFAFVKELQRTIQEQQRSIKELQILIQEQRVKQEQSDNISTRLEKLESLLSNK